MSKQDLCYLSATEAISQFRSRSLSPVELMQAVIDQAEKAEPVINAFTFRYFEEALEKAAASEGRYANGTPTGPLDGLPVAVKDEDEIAGQPTSNGSFTMENYIPDTTSLTIDRLLEAGAIVHARTATPEFSCAGYTWSDLWGVTRNPWNPDFTPGGSSGGSAASLAAGTSTLASGSDIGGSIRIPASCCGLVGYKPPYGRNPQEPPFNLDTYCHSGPLGRAVSDVRLMQNVMAGPHPLDIATIHPKLDLTESFEPIKGMKIAVSMDLGFFEIDQEVQANTEAAIAVLTSLGAEVETVNLPWSWDDLDAGMAHLDHIFGVYIGAELEENAERMTSYARAFAERAQKSTASDYFRSLEAEGRMYMELGPIFERCQALICPTNAIPAVKATHDQSIDKVMINGREVDPTLGWVMTLPFNMLSRCPVLSVPTGFASSGVPTGMQIVGAPYHDPDVFRIATAYETAIGGWFSKTPQFSAS